MVKGYDLGKGDGEEARGLGRLGGGRGWVGMRVWEWGMFYSWVSFGAAETIRRRYPDS